MGATPLTTKGSDTVTCGLRSPFSYKYYYSPSLCKLVVYRTHTRLTTLMMLMTKPWAMPCLLMDPTSAGPSLTDCEAPSSRLRTYGEDSIQKNSYTTLLCPD